MVDVERLLGSLLKQGLKSGRRSRRRRRSTSGLGGLIGGATLGMGALGIAIAAYEHFVQKKGAPSTAQGVTGTRSPGASPPPPPGPMPSAPPPPLPGPVRIQTSEAEVLIQAMVAAAHADGEIDATELRGIRQRMAEAGLSAKETEDLERRLSSPPTLEEILKLVESPRFGAQVYAVTLAAIEVDTDAERDYLKKLREGLKLPPEVIQHLHEQFDLDDQAS